MRRLKINGGAISYALFFILIVSIISWSFLLLLRFSKFHEIKETSELQLIQDGLEGINDFILNSTLDSLEKISRSGTSMKLKRKPWGMYNIITQQISNHFDTKAYWAIEGAKFDDKLPTLVLPRSNGGFTITKATHIDGDIIIPNGLLLHSFTNQNTSQSVQGIYNIKTSTDKLPNANLKGSTSIDFASKVIHELVDSCYSFSNETSIFKSELPIHLDQKVSDNLIIISSDSIFVSKQAKLRNIILSSPIIYFEEGFIGQVHITNSSKVVLSKNVKLTYPSSIQLVDSKNKTISAKLILNDNCHVWGGVLISTEIKQELNVNLYLENNSSIVGIIHNVGTTETYGSIIGTLMTGLILLRKNSKIYLNQSDGCLFSQKLLPENFIYPFIINESFKGTKIEIHEENKR